MADEALEDTIYDSQAARHFAGVDLASKNESVQGAGRHPAAAPAPPAPAGEVHALSEQILMKVNAYLGEQHLLL